MRLDRIDTPLEAVSAFVEDDIPEVSQDLLEWLERCFPVYEPQPPVPDQKVWYEFGVQKVLKLLRETHQNQQKPSDT